MFITMGGDRLAMIFGSMRIHPNIGSFPIL
jgi:hypothetical protein